jgi:hypothetical protein
VDLDLTRRHSCDDPDAAVVPRRLDRPASTVGAQTLRATIGSMAAMRADRDMTRLEDIPNVGPAIAADLRLVGVDHPDDLLGRDPYELYELLNEATGIRHDPCVLDTFIAAVRFVDGGPAMPWWSFTAERKRTLAARS